MIDTFAPVRLGAGAHWRRRTAEYALVLAARPGGRPRLDPLGAAHEAPGPDQLGHRPGLERAAGRRCGACAVGRLRHRAQAPLGEVVLQPVEQTVRVAARAQHRLDVRARSATATPCPGGRPRPVRPARRGGGCGSGDRTGRASADRARSRAARTPRTTRWRRRSGPWGSEAARSWLGRTDQSSPDGPSTTSARPARAGDRNRVARTRPGPAPPAAATVRASRPTRVSEAGDGGQPVDPQRVDLDRLAATAA